MEEKVKTRNKGSHPPTPIPQPNAVVKISVNKSYDKSRCIRKVFESIGWCHQLILMAFYESTEGIIRNFRNFVYVSFSYFFLGYENAWRCSS